MGKIFTIKSEDKAAFLNRLEKFGIAVDTYDIHDNKINKTFSVEFNHVIHLKNLILGGLYDR